MRHHRFMSSLLATTLAMAGTATAQGKTEAHFGVLAGMTLAKVGGPDTKDLNVKNRVGIAGGGFVTIGVHRNFAIEPEVLYAMKGAKESESGITGSIKVSYVEVPVLAKVRFPSKSGGQVSPHFYAGPYLGIKAGCTAKFTDNTTTVSQSCKDADIKIKSSDFGATFGAGVDVGRALIDVRYDLGLSKVSDETTANNVKSRTIFFLVGWTFRAAK